MMKLGRTIIQDELRMLDNLILKYRDKEFFIPKDFQPTTIKTKLGEIPIARRRYKMVINGKTKVELETDNKMVELEKVKELEKYLKNNEEAITRYQYKLGLKQEDIKRHEEDLPSLGSEESHMYCVCRDRMKKNRTSWSIEGSESLLKVIMNKMNGTLEEVLTKKAEQKIKEELAERIPEPKAIKKQKENKIVYAGKYEIANNFTGRAKQYALDLLREKKCSELMLIY